MTGVTLLKHNDMFVMVLCLPDVICDGPATVGGGGAAASEESEYVSVCGVRTHVEAIGHGVISDGHDTAVLLGEGGEWLTWSVSLISFEGCWTSHANVYGILIFVGDAIETKVSCCAPGEGVALFALLIKLSIGYSSGVIGAYEVTHRSSTT